MTDTGDAGKQQGTEEEVKASLEETKQIFRKIGEVLETRYRKYEDISRFSRDITWESKKTISMILSGFMDETLLEKAGKRFQYILKNEKLFQGLANAVHNEERFMYLRAYTPGVQEFIEALALYKFIKEKKLLTYEQLLKMLTFNVPAPNSDDNNAFKLRVRENVRYTIILPRTDFYMGLADVTGELMRACGSSARTPQFKQFLYESWALVRTMYQNLSSVSPPPRGLFNKLGAMRGNLIKMEVTCYNMAMNRNVGLESKAFYPVEYYYDDTEDSGYD